MKKTLFFGLIAVGLGFWTLPVLGQAWPSRGYLETEAGYTYTGDFEGPALGLTAGYRLDHRMGHSHNIELETLVFAQKGSNDFETDNDFMVLTPVGEKASDFLYVKRKIHLNEVPILLNYRYEKNGFMQWTNLNLALGGGIGLSFSHISEVVSGQIVYLDPGPAQIQSINSKDSSWKCKPMAQIFAGLSVQISDHTRIGISGKLMFSDQVGIRGTPISTKPAITGPDVETSHVRGLVAGTLTYLF